MNEHGLCGAWEVFMLRPIESLLLLQLGCMIKCHLCRHPHSPTHYPPRMPPFLSVTVPLSLVPFVIAFFFFLLPPCQLSLHFSPFHLSKCPDFPFSFSHCWLCLPFFTLSLLSSIVNQKAVNPPLPPLFQFFSSGECVSGVTNRPVYHLPTAFGFGCAFILMLLYNIHS